MWFDRIWKLKKSFHEAIKHQSSTPIPKNGMVQPKQCIYWLCCRKSPTRSQVGEYGQCGGDPCQSGGHLSSQPIILDTDCVLSCNLALLYEAG